MPEFTSKIIEDSGKGVFDIASNFFKKIGKYAIDEVKIRRATEQYAANYIKRFGYVKILGMPEPFPLMNLYTEVQVVSPAYRIKDRIIQELENDFRKTRGGLPSSITRLNGLAIANEHSRLNVLGQPGSGKSTFLRRVGLECLIPGDWYRPIRYVHNCIPVLVELRRFKNEPIDLYRLIQKEFEIANFPESDRFLSRALKEGILLILLDGLDEVPENILTELLDHVKDFTDKYEKNRFISSCRTAYYKNYLKNFTDVEISNFSEIQIQQFVSNWFSLDKDAQNQTSELFLRQLHQRENEATLELARTPLLLAFLCMTFDETQRFPSNRSSLYKQALFILMQKWAAEKRIHNEDIYKELNIELETEMLSDTAAFFYGQDKIFFYDHEIKKNINAFIDKKLSKNSLDISKVLEAIEVQQGILVERTTNIYSFSHLTIQEYLTAYYYNSPIKINQLISQHIFDKRWREVFLLLTGIGDPNDTLTLISNYLCEYAKANVILHKAIKWVREILIKDNDFLCFLQKKIFLLSLILRYKRYDTNWSSGRVYLEEYADSLIKKIPLSNEVDGITRSLSRTLNRKQAIYILEKTKDWLKPNKNLGFHISTISLMRPERPMSEMIMGSRHSYRTQIAAELYSALHTPEEICVQRKSTFTPVTNYLKGAELMLECASSTQLTSRAVWEKLCRNML